MLAPGASSGSQAAAAASQSVCNIFCLDFATLDCNTFVWTVISRQCVFCKWLDALTIFYTMYVVHVVYHNCYLHVLHVFNCNILGFRLIRRVSGIRGFRFRGWIFTRNDFRGGFGFQVRVSVLGAQTLHPIRTRPVAIFKCNRFCTIDFSYN